MTVMITKSALSLRDMLARLAGLERRLPPETNVFWFASAASLTMPRGWKPFTVDLKSGAPMELGAGYDYTLSSDGDIWTVTFVAGAPGSRVRVVAKRVKK